MTSALDAGDDSHRPAAGRAGLDIDAEDPPEALRPGHRGTALSRRPLSASVNKLNLWTDHLCPLPNSEEANAAGYVRSCYGTAIHPLATGSYMRIADQNAPSRYLSVYVLGHERRHLLHAFPAGH
jgi:hypothetical protein